MEPVGDNEFSSETTLRIRAEHARAKPEVRGCPICRRATLRVRVEHLPAMLSGGGTVTVAGLDA